MNKRAIIPLGLPVLTLAASRKFGSLKEASELGSRLRSAEAPMPIVRGTGEAVPFPDRLQ